MTNNTTQNPRAATVTMPFLILTVLFCVCLITANLIEIKTVNIGIATITAGMAVFPLSYIINDCIVEVYGFRRARLVIWLGFVMNLLFVMVLQLAIILPGQNHGNTKAHWKTFAEALHAYSGHRSWHLFAAQ